MTLCLALFDAVQLHVVRTVASLLSGIEEHNIRVVSPDIGGGFGNKVGVYPGYVCAIVASIVTGKPVKWVEDRMENLTSTAFARDYWMKGRISATKDGKITVRFEKDTARGLLLDQDVEVGFYVSGKDREFHHARARVNKSDYSVIVWNDEVSEPVAVRYGWSNLPAGGLMNARELPAYPFRTDDWPMTPHQSTGSYDVNSPDSLREN